MQRLAAFFTSSFSDVGDPRVLGLALHRAWIAAFFFSAGTIEYAAGSGVEASNLYMVSLVSLGLVLLLGSIAPLWLESLMRHRATQLASPLCMSLGSLLILATIISGGHPLNSIASGILTGAGSGMMFLYWGEFYGKSEATIAQKHSALSFTLSVFIYILFLFLSSTLLYVIMATILPLLAGLALLKAAPLRSSEREAHVITGGKTNLVRVALAALLISFVNGATKSIGQLLPSASATPLPSLTAETLFATTQLFSTLIIAILIFATIFVSQKSDLGLIYRLVLMFFIIGVLLSPLTTIFGVFSIVITNAGYSAFELIFWIALSNICYRYHVNPVRAFGIGRLAWVVGVMLGEFYPPVLFVESIQHSTLTAPLLLLSLLIVLIVVVNTFILTERNIIAITTGFANRRGNLQSRCKMLSEKYGLSHRENEVLAYLVKGRNLSSIKDALNISAGTVSTHRQRIYQKTGVHSRQELLDLLESTRSDKPDLQDVSTS